MKFKNCFLYLLFLILTCDAHQAIFRGIPITVYDGEQRLCGIDNCDMNSNGESFIIQKILPYSNIVFDVGANVGEWSSKALMSNPSISIYSFEPIPAIYLKLKRYLETISLNVKTYQIAISSCDGQKNFFAYEKNEGLTGLSGCYRRDESVEKKLNIMPNEFLVYTRSLDSFCNENLIGHIDFLKIDTEGSELDVFMGASSLLKSHKIDVVQFEYGGTYLSAHICLQQIYEMLTNYNYKIFQILPRQLMHISEWMPEIENYRYSNFLAIYSDLLTATES